MHKLNKFSAILTWGRVEQDPKIVVPSIFQDWQKNLGQTKRSSSEELNSHLKCFFIPSNLEGDITSIFSSNNFIDEEDFSASSIQIIDLDFSEGAIPALCVKADFHFLTLPNFSQRTIVQWEKENADSINFAISFEWNFKNIVEQPTIAINDFDELNFGLSNLNL